MLIKFSAIFSSLWNFISLRIGCCNERLIFQTNFSLLKGWSQLFTFAHAIYSCSQVLWLWLNYLCFTCFLPSDCFVLAAFVYREDVGLQHDLGQRQVELLHDRRSAIKVKMFAPANVHVGRSGTKTTNLKSGEEVVDIGTLLYKLTLLAINRDLIMCDLDAWIVNLGKAMKISI